MIKPVRTTFTDRMEVGFGVINPDYSNFGRSTARSSIDRCATWHTWPNAGIRMDPRLAPNFGKHA